jgi:hypothetical protein
MVASINDSASAAEPLPARTVQLLKLKGFTVSQDGTAARYSGRVEIEITRYANELEMCFILKGGVTLYAKPSGVLLVKESEE